MKSKHKGVKYACDQCDYQAPHKVNLKIHIISKHEGVKYYCNQCDFQFTQQVSLKRHLKSKHACDDLLWCDSNQGVIRDTGRESIYS